MKTEILKNNSAPPLGAHTSIAGGLQNALYSGKEIGCDVVQIFSKNQMQWKSKPLRTDDVEKFLEAKAETEVIPVTIHDSYLINLGSPKAETYRKSVGAFVDELRRCEQLQIPYLVMHPGSHMGEGEDAGLQKIAAALHQAYLEAGVKKTIILLETTAGQGTNLGYTFEQLQAIIRKSDLSEKIGVCLDTCHVFAAGYDVSSADGWKKTRQQFDHVIGLEKLKAFHLNDSKRELGSRVDRHERIGKGQIGLEGFRAIINDPNLQNIPMILEIPGGEQAYREDLQLLRSLKIVRHST